MAMKHRNFEGSVGADDSGLDTLARSLQGRLPRRRVAGLLAATIATGIFGIGIESTAVEARRKRSKRSKRRVTHRDSAEIAARTSIPPNCIYVCCDGKCDSWKMCLKCVTWPKPTTTTTVLAG
jgi:hypothetical protein